MPNLKKNAKPMVVRAEESEQKAHKIHEMADELHQKMKKLHMDTIAARERAHTTREKLKAVRSSIGKSLARRKNGKEL
jgi:hypothetical protein